MLPRPATTLLVQQRRLDRRVPPGQRRGQHRGRERRLQRLRADAGQQPVGILRRGRRPDRRCRSGGDRRSRRGCPPRSPAPGAHARSGALGRSAAGRATIRPDMPRWISTVRRPRAASACISPRRRKPSTRAAGQPRGEPRPGRASACPARRCWRRGSAGPSSTLAQAAHHRLDFRQFRHMSPSQRGLWWPAHDRTQPHPDPEPATPSTSATAPSPGRRRPAWSARSSTAWRRATT